MKQNIYASRRRKRKNAGASALEIDNEQIKIIIIMAQSVSNDALWLKLSEMDKKLDKLSKEQESPVPTQEPTGNKPDSTVVKGEVITKIKDEIVRLGQSNDSHFGVNKNNVEVINENILKTFKQVEDVQKQLTAYINLPKVNKGNYFNLWFFKIRRTSFIITILGLLVFILTLFCMKQQNDYSLLMDEYRKQDITIQKLDGELKALEEKSLKKQQKK
jgi:hypothetical protein